MKASTAADDVERLQLMSNQPESNFLGQIHPGGQRSEGGRAPF